MWYISVKDGMIRYGVPDNGASSTIDFVETSIEVNAWQHIVLVFDGTHYSLYKDGELAATLEKTTNMINSSPTAKTLVGAVHHSSQVFDVFYSGVVDDIRIYDRSLSFEEIGELYQID